MNDPGHCPSFLALTLLFAALPAVAQDYPNRVIRMVVPQPPGGGADIVARLISQKLGETLGQQIVVDNRAGAGGIVGTELVARAQPDGYTLLIGITGSLTINPGLYKNLPYRPLEDFEPISLAVATPFLLVANSSVRANSVRELIALAKGGPVNYSTPGTGSLAHLAMEWFRTATGTELIHVPYKGSQAFGAVVAGEIPITLVSLVSGMPQMKAGRVKALAITSKTRSGILPELPTIAESGVPGFEATNWFGLLAPRHTPPAIVEKLHQTIASSVRGADVKTRLAQDGANAIGGTPQEFKDLIRTEIKRWADVIKLSGARVD
jgi:tripartite-type tricarboxylate transporter receptor subunit TctC